MNLDYFKGKICTILTSPTAKDFNKEPKEVFHQYFTGEVLDYTPEGIFMEQVNSSLKSFFTADKIVGIVEEEILNPDIPEHAKTIEKIKEVTNKKFEYKASNKVDPENMAKLAEQMKQTFSGTKQS